MLVIHKVEKVGARPTIGFEKPIKQRQNCNVTALITFFSVCCFTFESNRMAKLCSDIAPLVHHRARIRQRPTGASVSKVFYGSLRTLFPSRNNSLFKKVSSSSRRCYKSDYIACWHPCRSTEEQRLRYRTHLTNATKRKQNALGVGDPV